MDKEVFETFIKLGEKLKSNSRKIPYKKIERNNAWFIPEFVDLALSGLLNYLKPQNLDEWLKGISIRKKKTIGLVTAGNIPLVGFHDLMCVLILGYNLKLKPSSKDSILLKWLVRKIFSLNPGLKKRIEIVRELPDCDAYIATGSNNTNRFFEYAFGSKPHLIRNNRTSIAILSGEENETQLQGLADDIFQYFGLGCRNVSFLYLPVKYNLEHFKPFFHQYSWLAKYEAYWQNYQYNLALLKLNKKPFFDFENLLLIPDDSIHSPISAVYFNYYNSRKKISGLLRRNRDNIQCIVGDRGLSSRCIPFGSTQQPGLHDYNDGKNTLEFLARL